MADALHSIKAVARRTGLSGHVIRIWEKRYGVVTPARSGTNRRLYSDEEIERLGLLRELTLSGHNIGNVAKLPTRKLRELLTESRAGNGELKAIPTSGSASATLLDECLHAVKDLNATALEDTMNRAAIALGAQGLLQRLIAPLAQTIGDLWCEGTITAAHEHFASAVMRLFLGHAARPFAASEGAPVIVVATPSGQLHELGSLLVGATAANLGWRVTYLGASLPAAEIAGASQHHRARAVALSLVYPEDDPHLETELIRLREMLPVEVALLAGGRAAPSYQLALEKAGARQIKDLSHLCSVLDALRSPAWKRKT